MRIIDIHIIFTPEHRKHKHTILPKNKVILNLMGGTRLKKNGTPKGWKNSYGKILC